MDSIANMFTQLKNAAKVGKKEVQVNYSKLNLAILNILKEDGFVANFAEVLKDNKKYPVGILVDLRYVNKNEPAFTDIKRVSRPGRRIYISSSTIGKQSRGKAGILISTSQGVMSGVSAKKKGLGGEVIGEVIYE